MSTASFATTNPIPNADPTVAAKAAGLRYVNDTRPGIRRKDGKFFDAAGAPVTDEATLARIKALVIPPAWTDVWICAQANGHLQATGRDARGRKQYRYHAKWRTVRDDVKYVDRALKLPGLPREKVLATIVYLLEATMMRIGNEEYARTNKSFGLTTLHNRHVKVDGSDIAFHFRGKSGVFHDIELHDRRLAKIIARTRELPGQELCQGLPYLVRHRAGRAGLAGIRKIRFRNPGQKEYRAGHRVGRGQAGQHAVDLPQVLCPPGRAGSLPGRQRARGAAHHVRESAGGRPARAHAGRRRRAGHAAAAPGPRSSFSACANAQAGKTCKQCCREESCAGLTACLLVTQPCFSYGCGELVGISYTHLSLSYDNKVK
jgi:hypothetical protein